MLAALRFRRFSWNTAHSGGKIEPTNRESLSDCPGHVFVQGQGQLQPFIYDISWSQISSKDEFGWRIKSSQMLNAEYLSKDAEGYIPTVWNHRTVDVAHLEQTAEPLNRQPPTATAPCPPVVARTERFG